MAAGNRRASVRIVTGDKELDAVLQKLKVGTANRIVRPAIVKASQHVLKTMKGNLPSRYKNIAPALGSRVDNKGGARRKDPQAKIGAGVGKAYQKAARRSGRNRGKGSVGISGRNIHWIILGTTDRYHKSGKWVGKMPPILLNLVQDTAASTKSTVESIIRTEAARRLEELVKKR